MSAFIGDSQVLPGAFLEGFAGTQIVHSNAPLHVASEVKNLTSSRLRPQLKAVMKRVVRKLKSKLKNPSAPSIMEGSLVSRDTQIGDYTYIGVNCSITKAQIGRYCSIANNVSIGPGEHALNGVSTSSLFYEDAYTKLTEKPCVIGNDVWIGVDCIIRRGVRIGNGAVIGANSFVNSDVPDFAVVAGTPAKHVKFRFTPEQISRINTSKWWDLELKAAKELLKKLSIELELDHK